MATKAAPKKAVAPTKSADERALDSFMTRMGKAYGEKAFTSLADTKLQRYQVIPTGSITLDHALTVGGWVTGRLHQIWGPDGAGKTTLALMTCAEALKVQPDKRIGYIDAEHRLDLPWVIDHGVDINRMVHVQPENAEDVADMMKDMCRSGLFSVVVLDSIGSMIGSKQIDKNAEDATVGIVAKIVTRMVQIASVEAPKTNTTPILLNQVRANIAYGADTHEPGGYALRHATTSKIKLKRGGALPFKAKINGEDRTVGHQIAAIVERNSVGPAYRTAFYNHFNVPTARYGPIGIDRVDEAVTLGLSTKIIEQGGAWYTVTVTGERVNGKEQLVEMLRSQPQTVTKIREAALDTVADQVTEERSDDEIQMTEALQT